MKFKIGDKVKIREDAALRFSKSIPAHMGFNTAGFRWLELLKSGMSGNVQRVFPSGEINVLLDNGKLIGIKNTELVLISKRNPYYDDLAARYPFIVGDWNKIKRAVKSGVSYHDVAYDMEEIASYLKHGDYPLGEEVMESLENGLFDTAYGELKRGLKKLGVK